jgi:hypothetical protein
VLDVVARPRPGVGFADLFDEMDERLIADALVFAPII